MAELHEHTVGHEFLLFSWRRVVCDLALAAYLLFMSFFILLLGQNVTTNVVENALFRSGPRPTRREIQLIVRPSSELSLLLCLDVASAATGSLFSYTIFSPTVTFLQTALTRSIVTSIAERIKANRDSFTAYYRCE